MYKFNRNRQFCLSDFKQPTGLKMNPENRWIKKAETIPWNEIEEQYASLFPGETGMPAKPLQTALGSLLIQKQYGYSDRELVEQIRENPYYQYFIGLPGYRDEIPFVPSLNLTKSGMNPKTLQYIMGHSNISVTLNTYTHVGFEDAESELQRVING